MAKTIYPQKIVEHYIDKISKHITVSKVLLFGSFAYGKPNKNSDIDLLVVSPDFKKKDFMERLEYLSLLRDEPTYTIAMDIVGYTPEEFKKMEHYSPHLAQIKKRGKVIYP